MATLAGLKPYYPHRPIGSIVALARLLSVHPKLLTDIAKKSSNSYTSFQVESNSGKIRDVFEPKFELKKLQKRVNSKIFEAVYYPEYLTGGIKDPNVPRDWVLNASAHAGSDTLIKLDIKNFYSNIESQHVKYIFLHLFNFPPSVAELLTNLTTLNGRLPQGAPTSSYLANLVFFDCEYLVASHLLHSGYRYSRLLDDITISSLREVNATQCQKIIKTIAALCRKKGLKLRNSKTSIEHSRNSSSSYEVTGAWVGHNVVKLKRSERRYVRQLVYACECSYADDPEKDEFHELWNRASGKVAKMERLGHTQAANLRIRLADILPRYGPARQSSLKKEVKRLCKRSHQNHRIGLIKRVNRSYYELGILARNNRPLAKHLRGMLDEAFHVRVAINTKDYWLN